MTIWLTHECLCGRWEWVAWALYRDNYATRCSWTPWRAVERLLTDVGPRLAEWPGSPGGET